MEDFDSCFLTDIGRMKKVEVQDPVRWAIDHFPREVYQERDSLWKVLKRLTQRLAPTPPKGISFFLYCPTTNSLRDVIFALDSDIQRKLLKEGGYQYGRSS